MKPLHFLVPGQLDRPTGGSRYDQRIIAGLRAVGMAITVHALAGRYPGPDSKAQDTVEQTLRRIPAETTVIVDGLVLGGLPGPFTDQARRLRLIAVVHHPLADETGLSAARRQALLERERAALRAVRGVITTSAFTAERLRELGLGILPSQVVAPGCDPAPLAHGQPSDQPPLLLCVASLTPRKGHDVLIDALTQLRDLPWHCRLVGSTELAPDWAQEMRGRIRQNGLERRIDVAGALAAADLDAAYAGADLFVLPSHYEGYGMVITEAIARGLPVVTTNGGALPGTLPPQAGYAVPVADSDALATALGQLLRDPAQRDALARGARRARQRLTDWPAASRRFAAALAEITDYD